MYKYNAWSDGLCRGKIEINNKYLLPHVTVTISSYVSLHRMYFDIAGLSNAQDVCLM